MVSAKQVPPPMRGDRDNPLDLIVPRRRKHPPGQKSDQKRLEFLTASVLVATEKFAHDRTVRTRADDPAKNARFLAAMVTTTIRNGVFRDIGRAVRTARLFDARFDRSATRVTKTQHRSFRGSVADRTSRRKDNVRNRTQDTNDLCVASQAMSVLFFLCLRGRP